MSVVGLLPVTTHLAWANSASGYAVSNVQKYRWVTVVEMDSVDIGIWTADASGPGHERASTEYGTHISIPHLALVLWTNKNRPRFNVHAAAFFSICVFGSAIGVAVSAVIFQISLRKKLENIPQFAGVDEKYSRDATLIAEVMKDLDAGSTLRSLMIRSQSH
ncbi:hypothetical protein PG997_006169 [Apiospora hydei]|uniref:Transmembrane protein n=1 Tax=Apiospora hydei TaxID=1337664 RepID=A0ABR1WN00_9PEZI